MRANSGGIRALTWAASLCVVLQAPACAKDLVLDQGRWVQRGAGISIGQPGRGVDSGPGGGAWQRVDVDGALLTFRGPDDARMSMIRNCGAGRGEPRVLARLLLIGLTDREILEEGEVTVAGGPGWRQAVSARQEGRALELISVTRTLGDCSLDWVVITKGSHEEVEADFDAWWSSFRVDSPELAGALSAEPPAAAAEASPEAGR